MRYYFIKMVKKSFNINIFGERYEKTMGNNLVH